METTKESLKERKDRIFKEIEGAAKRMAIRHCQKAGLPWQWRDDIAQDLIKKALEVYPRYAARPDEDLIRILVKVMYHEKTDIGRKSVSEYEANHQQPPFSPDFFDRMVSHNFQPSDLLYRRIGEPTFSNMAKAVTALGRLAGFTEDEKRVLDGVANEKTAAQIASETGWPRSTVEYRLRSARKKCKDAGLADYQETLKLVRKDADLLMVY